MNVDIYYGFLFQFISKCTHFNNKNFHAIIDPFHQLLRFCLWCCQKTLNSLSFTNFTALLKSHTLKKKKQLSKN